MMRFICTFLIQPGCKFLQHPGTVWIQSFSPGPSLLFSNDCYFLKYNTVQIKVKPYLNVKKCMENISSVGNIYSGNKPSAGMLIQLQFLKLTANSWGALTALGKQERWSKIQGTKVWQCQIYGKDLGYVKCTAAGPTLCNNGDVV